MVASLSTARFVLLSDWLVDWLVLCTAVCVCMQQLVPEDMRITIPPRATGAPSSAQLSNPLSEQSFVGTSRPHCVMGCGSCEELWKLVGLLKRGGGGVAEGVCGSCLMWSEVV